jgi:aminomethyltransferase
MNEHFLTEYLEVRENGAGLIEFENRGLIEVSGGEAEMFLTGLITNDVKTLQENSWMNAAFPNAQGRLLAVVKVWKSGGKFYFDTEDKTYETVLKNLERFTLAGDFKVADLSKDFVCLSVQGKNFPALEFNLPDEKQIIETEFEGEKLIILNNADIGEKGFYFYVSKDAAEKFKTKMHELGIKSVSDQAFEVLRIESGLPIYGIDMDDSTVVPEVNLHELINYNKGCYIGQEVIARIHFRGHVAKQLTGVIFENVSEPLASAGGLIGAEIKTLDDKNAGKITSVIYSPKLEKQIALAYVRYAYLEEGTELTINDSITKVKNLPFLK